MVYSFLKNPAACPQVFSSSSFFVRAVERTTKSAKPPPPLLTPLRTERTDNISTSAEVLPIALDQNHIREFARFEFLGSRPQQG
jgi:hypothetical protein